MPSFDQTQSESELEHEVKLVLPGMRSKVVGAPPPLERLESYVTSPCVSDSTLTSRRLREMIPCTPSPMYSYDIRFGPGTFGSECHQLPRFFPFALSQQPVPIPPQMASSKASDYDRFHYSHVSPAHSESSAGRSSPTFLISPGSVGRPESLNVSTPIAENAVAEEHAAREAAEVVTKGPTGADLMAQLKQTNGLTLSKPDLSDIPISKVVAEVVELSKDQVGSRFLQQLIDAKLLTPVQLQELFMRILPETKTLTLDAFGNYVVQKLIDVLSLENRIVLLDHLWGSIFPMSIHMYGCRVVQKLIDTTNIDKQMSVGRELKGHVVKCVEDQNGNHVIQKLIEFLPSEKLNFIVSEFLGNISVMAVHCYGCRVLQRLLEKLRPWESADLVGEILANLWHLSQDQYGNYVIQHVLSHGTPQNRSVIVQVIASHIIEFSCHKYASNIAEKALLCSDDQTSRDLLISAVLGSGGPDAPIHVLMKDRFANYVIQRCLEFSHGDQRNVLVGILKTNLPLLKRVIYGKHIANAIERIIATEPTAA